MIQRRGSAYLMVIGLLGVLVILAGLFSRSSVSGRFLTVRSANDQRTMELAEAASNLCYKLIAEEVNDPQVLYDILEFRNIDLDSWFLKFRLPEVPISGSTDAPQMKTKGIQEENSGSGKLGFELNLGSGLARGKKYTQEDMPELRMTLDAMGGRTKITADAKIIRSFGILPRSESYNVPGVTLDTSKEQEFSDNWIRSFLNKLAPKDPIKIDLGKMVLDRVPDINFGVILSNALAKIKMNVALWGVSIPVPIGAIVKPILAPIIKSIVGDSVSLKGFLRDTLLKNLKVEIDLSKLKEILYKRVTNFLPTEISAFTNGKIGWGVSLEKIGILEVLTTVEYQPQGAIGPTIKKVLRTQRDFRVADIQPVAPDYSFFVANSKLLFENDIENKNAWKGNDKINWAEGKGALIIHNFSLCDGKLFGKFRNFLEAIISLNIEKFSHSLYLPGLVRVNGTQAMEIPLNFGLMDSGGFLDRMKKCEVAALLVNDEEKNAHYNLRDKNYPESETCVGDYTRNYKSHNITPDMGESFCGIGRESPPPLSILSPLRPVPHFDWPWLTDSKVWFPVPKVYNQTLLFGDFHVEFPLSLRVEGNLWKKFSRMRLHMIRIFIPLNWFFGAPNIDFTLPPVPMNTTVVEPYGFCSYPPMENQNHQADPERMKTAWNPDDPTNLPENIYSPYQYIKKASYYYKTTSDFADDVENRSAFVDLGTGKLEKVFLCDGVSFVENTDGQGLFLPDLKVLGRGVIVAAGNIHLTGDIQRVEPPNAPLSMLSIVARNGAILNKSERSVEACLYADRGLMMPIYAKLKVYGNLVINQFNRKACQGTLDVHYESNRCHSSIMSYFKDISKYDPTRYQANISKKWRQFVFEQN
jgi:hypothetical protein